MHLTPAFRQRLRELGYKEGQDIILERRYGESERLSDLAAELVQLKVDIIVTTTDCIRPRRRFQTRFPLALPLQ